MLFRRAHHLLYKWPATPNVQKFLEHSATELLRYFNDTQTGMLLRIPRSARCVQRFDDSLNSAIHITYRISLRSSSMREPRDPLLKVVLYHLKAFVLKKPYNLILYTCNSVYKNAIDTQTDRKKSIITTNLSFLSVYKTCTGGKMNEISSRNVHMLISQQQSLPPIVVQ